MFKKRFSYFILFLFFRPKKSKKSKKSKTKEKPDEDFEDGFDKMERERREDLEERDAFAQRVIKRDKEKQRNVSEKVKKQQLNCCRLKTNRG